MSLGALIFWLPKYAATGHWPVAGGLRPLDIERRGGEMDERERIIREVIKVLPELARSLNRDATAHASGMYEAAQMATAPGAAQAGTDVSLGRRAVPGAAAAPEVSAAQLRTLIHLAQYGPQTMGELAEGMQITMASATGLVKPLVALGYVTRSRAPHDQRVVRVALSGGAQEMADRLLAERRREVEAALSGMNDQACRDFLEGLERLVGRNR
jgi:DNA-binding MarR family transcriptional regulator